ncbi:MAG TPA: nuclear transport factor 2 family protein [Candidatus Limnocylindrales bacterium]|nr:nuclear transport factor 2 family protein [Candidatus Limnocylindrales bacterium]
MTKRNWIIVGAITGFVAVLCCVAGIVGGTAWLNRETPERVVDAYLSAVQQRDRPRAERMLCDGLRHGAAGRMTGLAQDWMEVVDWEITGSHDTDKSAEVTARVTVKLTGVATTLPFGFILIKENGDWRICGFKNNGLNLS